jgi:phage anti-repressor protein
MEDFLKKFATVPPDFLHDFLIIAKEEYSDNQIVINFETVAKWLITNKSDIKKILISKFIENIDYTIKKIKKTHTTYRGASLYEEILITPDCFKTLCMISQTEKAKEVRKYFLDIEKLVKRYYETIKESLYKKIGLLETNQKPKINIKGGVVYIIRALNSEATLYKLGKSKDLRYRLNGYNSGNANDIEPLFILQVNDIDNVETCIKKTVKEYQYRKYKEVYEIDIEILKKIMEKCDQVVNEMAKFLKDISKKKQFNKKISRMKKSIDKHFIFISKDE